MKTYIIKSQLPLPVLIAYLGMLTLAGRVTAQTFTTLYSFSPTTPSNGLVINSDGAEPTGGLILSSNTLYGAADQGGDSGNGTVFAINTDGTDFSTLHVFTAQSSFDEGTNPDGASPNAVVLFGNTLYGAARYGGGWDNGRPAVGAGTVFAVNTDGTGFTALQTFTGGNASIPRGPLVVSGSSLYGTTDAFYEFNGTVFKLNTDGTGFAILHSFSPFSLPTNGIDPAEPPFTNSDGARPLGRLNISGNTAYGTTCMGGTWGEGTVFKVNTDGSGFTTLHSFTLRHANSGGVYTNSDGAGPVAGLTSSGNTLLGTTGWGGSWGYGTIFALNADGSGFSVLHTFTNASWSYCSDRLGNPCSNSELLLSGNTLYGTTADDVFAISTDGTGFTVLHSFTGQSDGGNPSALVLSENTLYGTARVGGSGGSGTIFSISLPVGPPQLTIKPAGSNVILSWRTNATGFTLQSTTNLGLSAFWITNSPAPVVVNGQNTVTNPISGIQQFYRLSQ